MPAELQLKEYLDNATESSKRIRTILIILVVVNVLILAGFLNSWQGMAWNAERLRFFQDYIRELDIKINELQHFQPIRELKEEKPKPQSVLLMNLPPRNGAEVCEAANDQLKCYEEARWRVQKFLEESINAYVDNTYMIRVPFFGVAFDINDLGVIGGLSLIVILIMLRLNLRNFIVSLRIGFKAAREAGMHPEFYDVLAGRQVFAFPGLGDSKQEPYEGRTEAIWSESTVKSFYDLTVRFLSVIFYWIQRLVWGAFKVLLLSSKKEKPKQYDEAMKNGWHSNPHPLLALVPTWICLVPVIVYAFVVLNDYWSYEIGYFVNERRTKISVGFSLVCLVVIFGLGCWCVSKWIEINELWKIFSDPAKLHYSSDEPVNLDVLKKELIRTGRWSLCAMGGLSVAMLVFSIMEEIRGDWSAKYLPLVFGSIVGTIAGASYYLDIQKVARGKNKGSLSFLFVPFGILTYCFTVYLFFYFGIRSLFINIYQVSYPQILLSIGVCSFSFYKLKNFQRLTGSQGKLRRLVGRAPISDAPDVSQIKATLDKWMKHEVPTEQVQSVDRIFSTAEGECETIITSTNKWHWKATFRRSKERRWYLATMIMCGRKYEVNLDVKQIVHD